MLINLLRKKKEESCKWIAKDWREFTKRHNFFIVDMKSLKLIKSAYAKIQKSLCNFILKNVLCRRQKQKCLLYLKIK